MSQWLIRSSLKLRSIAVLIALALAACGSPEEQAKHFYEHGIELLAQHENARAGIEFRNALRKKADFLPAWVALAQVEETDRHWGAMIPILRRILELQPKDNETRLKLARLVFLSGALDEALNLANAVEDENNQNADALALKAAILFRLKDSNGGVRQAEAALKINPKNAGAIGVIAADRLARGDAKGALAMLDSGPASDANDLGLQLFKLKIFEQIQDLKQVEALLRKFVERYPEEVDFRRQLVRLYVFQHRGDDADKEASAIVSAHPNDAKIFLEYVSLLNTLKGAPVARKELVSRVNSGGDVFSYQVALAQFDFANGNFEDSRALLDRLISEDKVPEHVLTAQIALAQIYLNRKKTEPAEELVSDILRKDSRNTAGLKLRASIRLDRAEFEPAINDLRQALNDQPRATELMLLLALAYERSGSVDLAEKEFADAIKASNFDAAVGLDYIAFLERRGSVERAEDILNELANRWPRNTRILSALAQLRLARGNWVGAQEIADSIRRAGDEQGVADQVLGAALAGQNKLQESIGALQSAYAAAPGSVQPMLSLVTVYMRAQQPDKAVSFLQSVIKANPANAEAYVLLGSVALTNKVPDDALKNFMTAIEKQPKNPAGYQAAARFYIGQKKFDEAEKLVRAGIKELPTSTALRLTLTSILEQTGNFDSAISEYEALLADDPNSLIAANNLASLLADHRSDKASLDRSQVLAASLRKSPVPQFKDTLGWVDFRQGDYKSAKPLLEEAVAALPNLPVVHYHLGMTYIAVGEPAKANEQLKLASKGPPDGDLKGKIEEAMKNAAK